MAKKTTKALVVTKASMTKAVEEATTMVKTLKVKSEADFTDAANFLKKCVETKAIIKAYYKPKEDVVKADLKKITDERATYDNLLKAAEEAARMEIEAYKEKKDAALAAAAKKAAVASRATGTYVTPRVKEAPAVAGLSFREVWDFEIQDQEKFMRWCFKALVDRMKYLSLDDVAIRAYVNEQKKEGEILPGIVASKHQSSVVRK